MKKAIPKKATRQILVKDVSKDYGITLSGNQDIPFSEYLKRQGNKGFGKALETLERELKSA